MSIRISQLVSATRLSFGDWIPVVQDGVTLRAGLEILPESPQTSSKLAVFGVKNQLEKTGLNGGLIDTFEDASGIDFDNSDGVRHNGNVVDGIPLVSDFSKNTTTQTTDTQSLFVHFFKFPFLSKKTLNRLIISVSSPNPGGVGVYSMRSDGFIDSYIALTGGEQHSPIREVNGSVTTTVAWDYKDFSLYFPEGGFIGFETTSGSPRLVQTPRSLHIATKPEDTLDPDIRYRITDPPTRTRILNGDTTIFNDNQDNGDISCANCLMEFSSTDPLLLETTTTEILTSPKDITVAFVTAQETDAFEQGNFIVEVSLNNGATWETMSTGKKDTVNNQLRVYTYSKILVNTGTQLKARITVNQPNTAVFHGLGLFLN